ncbi:MAG: sulfoxide reductase heme-binding subunit YedZ [Rhizobacter sp.]|nr:sulfoxide reductase heme-binding subunit YedZ [Rhizobacter sp.]
MSGEATLSTAPPRRVARATKLLLHPAGKVVLALACLIPFAWLLQGAIADTLGPNPAEALLRSTGDWTLRFLCATLAITPLRQLTGQAALARYRRMLGLFTFFYGSVHFLCYSWLDMGFVLGDIVRDIPKRPFVLVGTTALLLMLPMAATSFNAAIRALGAARWKMLHRAIYLIAVLGLLHFYWMRAAKNHFGEPTLYAAIIALLLAWRIRETWRARQRTAVAPR